jgi:D-amino-acid dehydrogenase
MFTKDAPLLIRPRIDLKMWKWMAKFLYHTFKGDYEQNTATTIQLGVESRKLYDEICNEESIEFDRSDCGILHFYKDEAYWNNAKEVKDLYYKNGGQWQLLSPHEAVIKDKSLYKIKGMIGCAWTPDDWTGDIHKFCYNLASVLAFKYDVKFKYNTSPDVNLLLSLDGFDDVVISAGVGSVDLAKQVGDTLDIYPVKGYSITINNVDPEYLPKVSLLDDQAKIVTSSIGNRFRVAGTAELNGENYDIVRDRIEPLLKWVHTNFPNINTHDYTSWACLRPMTPNMMPITKRSDKNKNVYYNTGHGHLGWTLGPVTAKHIAEMI